MLEEDFEKSGRCIERERERETVGNGYFGQGFESLIVNVTRTGMSY